MKIRNCILLMASFLCMTACDYEDINTSTTGVSDDELKQKGLLYGAPFMAMQQRVIPIGSPSLTTGPGNDLQNTDLISSGSYIGYFGNNNNWATNPLEATWHFTEERMVYSYQNFYSTFFQSWIDIRNKVKDSELPSDLAVAALSDIVKIMAWSRATDVFGPIAYTRAGQGEISPKFDSQEEVYKAMLAELADAVAVLNQAPSQILPAYDLIYGGNTAQWVKLANSMMLRLAVRTHFKNETLAREYIAKALDPANGGVLEAVSDAAKIGDSALMPLKNSMMPSVEEYGETRMGATIWAYLTGYDDGRAAKMFTQVEDWYGNPDYEFLPPTNNQAKSESTAGGTSKPIVSDGSPLYWMRASEVYFLRAEAVLYELAAGDVKSLYESGVRTSFEEFGATGVDSYLQKKVLPADIEYGTCSFNRSYSSNMSTGNTSPCWTDYKTSDQKEEQLQKIMTQKYLALYPNAVEAWTEYRRTGYPYVAKPADTQAYSRIGAAPDARTPERFRFAPSEYQTNPNMAEIPTLLGGPDQGSTPLWWVRDGRPKQPNN